jgi:hypothetical protein
LLPSLNQLIEILSHRIDIVNLLNFTFDLLFLLSIEMWCEADEIVELFRGYLPYYLIIALPLFIIIAPVSPVGAAHEFPAHRMQQYDLHGVPHGKKIIRPKTASLAIWHSIP